MASRYPMSDPMIEDPEDPEVQAAAEKAAWELVNHVRAAGERLGRPASNDEIRSVIEQGIRGLVILPEFGDLIMEKVEVLL